MQLLKPQLPPSGGTPVINTITRALSGVCIEVVSHVGQHGHMLEAIERFGNLYQIRHACGQGTASVTGLVSTLHARGMAHLSTWHHVKTSLVDCHCLVTRPAVSDKEKPVIVQSLVNP